MVVAVPEFAIRPVGSLFAVVRRPGVAVHSLENLCCQQTDMSRQEVKHIHSL